MDIVCESCGVSNKQGTEFCLFCGNYLAWDRSVLVPPRSSTPAAPAEPASSARSGPSAVGPTPARPGVASAAPPVQPAQPVTPVAPRTQPSPADPAPAPGPVAATRTEPRSPHPTGAGCPACGRVNDPARRFCAKCGQVLGGGAPGSGTPGRATPAWRQTLRSRDRSARIAYRRSLPPLYRWRRVLVGVLVAALALGGIRAVGRQPVRWALAGYDDLRNATVIVPNVQASIEPPEATAPDSKPAALTDLTQAAWTMTWRPSEQGASCGGAPGTGVIVLSIAPTRIRGVDLEAGLLATDANRPLQFRPNSIGISFDGGPCHGFPLPDTPARQHLEVDSGVAVRTVRIGVDTAYPAREDGQALLSFTEILLRSRPVR